MYSHQDIENMLPHLLKRHNIARYENGKVYIGNRATYPFEVGSLCCESVEEVALAIESMVTQGVGPWIAAVYAMAMRADQLSGKTALIPELEAARTRLAITRPTNTLIRYRLEDTLNIAMQALQSDLEPSEEILKYIQNTLDNMYENYGQRAQCAAKLLDDGDGVLTMCFAESAFILTMAMAKAEGKSLTAYVPETRPYLQGARLTAPSLKEVGIEVFLITDNMPTALMAEGRIQKYMTAADLITLDGHVVNKVGTFQNAIAARAHGIPYFAYAWGCDKNKPDRASIEIEYRDAADIRTCRGVPTTLDDMGAVYPAFDITPPEYVSGVITKSGVLSPYMLKDGFE